MGIAGMEFMGKILITVFVVGMVVILLQIFLPATYNDGACPARQAENLLDLFEEAESARYTVVKEFSIEGCVEYIDFSPISCTPEGSDGETRRCYEILAVGQVEGNCKKMVCGGLDECPTCTDPLTNQLTKKGNFWSVPGPYDNIDIQCPGCEGGPTRWKFKSGKYSVRIGPHSLEFARAP